MEIKLNKISEKRKEIMGIATLLVIFVHIWYDTLPTWVEIIRPVCQVGVDIFLLLSGLGCYYSLKKNSICRFYWNRIKRVLVPFIIVFLSWNIFRIYCWDYSWCDAYSTYSLFGLFWNSTSTWFILCIFIFYLVSPLIYKKLTQSDYSILYAVFIIIIVTSSLLSMYLPDPWYSIDEYIIMRFPVYLIGFYIAKQLDESPDKIVKLNFKFWLLFILNASLITLNFIYNKTNVIVIFRYLSISLSYFLCIIMALIFNRGSWLLKFIGNRSLECYLLFERLTLVSYIYLPINNLEINIVAFIGSLVVGSVIKLLIDGKKKVIH